MSQIGKVVLVWLLAFAFNMNAVEPSPIEGRFKRSLNPLQSTAESARLRTTELYHDYCAQVSDMLYLYNNDPIPLGCHTFAAMFTSTSSLPPMPFFNDTQTVTKEDLKVLMNATYLIEDVLTQLVSVGSKMLETHDLCRLGFMAQISESSPSDVCLLECDNKGSDIDRDFYCSLEHIINELQVFKMLGDHLRLETSASEVFTGSAPIDVTPNDSQTLVRYYSIVALDYSTEMTELIVDTISKYLAQGE